MATPSAVISATFDEKQLANSLERAIGKAPALRGLSGNLRQFDQQLDRANRRVLAFGASASIVYGTVRAFKALVDSGIEVEKSLASINSIFQLTSRQLDAFGKDLFNAARFTGQSFRDTARAAEEFSRQGLTAAETAKRTRDAMLLVRLTGLETTKAVDLLTAAMNTFGKTGADTTSILNKLVAVDQRFAVSAKDIANAIARAGSVVDDSNVSLEQFAGLVTAARQITSREGAVIGNSLKTIFSRLERTTTLDSLEALGIAVRDASGNARNALDVFDEVAKSYRTLNREQQQQVAELGAGVYQINQFKALLLDLGKANGIAAQATNAAANASNEALVRNAALNDTLAHSIQNLKTSATEAGALVGQLTIAPTLKGLVGTGSFIADLFSGVKATGDTKAAEDFGAYVGESILKGLGNVLAGAGSIFLGRAIVGVVRRTGKDAVSDVQQAAGFSTAAGAGLRQPEVTSLTTVNALLDGATKKERDRFLAAKTVADQEAAILSILNAQIAAQAKLAGQAAAATSGGLRGGAARRYRTPGAAEGYVPHAAGGLTDALRAERAAIGAGVGGAPAGARPVYLPGFNRGGGQRGIVANSSERRVRTGGGEAIYNEQMIQRLGLPPGSVPVAAGGFIPSAAGGDVDGPLPAWARHNMDALYAEMERKGLVDKVVQMAAQRMTAAQIAGKLGIEKDSVFAVRSRFGIPSMDDTTGFNQWLKAHATGGGGKLPSVTPRYGPTDVTPATGALVGYGPFQAGKQVSVMPNPQQLNQLNQLFANLAKAGSVAEASRFGAQIVDMAKAFDKASSSRIMKDLAGQMDRIAKLPATTAINRTIGQYGSVLPYGPTLPPTAFANQAIAGMGSAFAGLPPSWQYGRSIHPGVGAMFASRALDETGMGSVAPYGPFQPYTARLGNEGIISENRSLSARLRREARLKEFDELAADPAEQKRIEADLRRDRQRFRVQQELRRAHEAEARFARRNTMANRTQFATIAGSFGAAFLPEGEGGTAEGKAFGALSTGLQGAAIGAGAGTLFGPVGTMVGAVVGGLGGAVQGFISKSQKSFEELAKAIDEANSRSARVIEGATQFLGFQGNIREAIDRGQSSQVIGNILKQQRGVASTLPGNVLRQLIDAGFDESKQAEALSNLNTTLGEARTKEMLKGALASLGDPSKTNKASITTAAEALRASAGQAGGRVRSLLRRAEVGDIGPGFDAAVGFDGAALVANVGAGSSLRGDIETEIGSLVNAAKLDQDQKDEVMSFVKRAKNETLIQFLQAFQNSADNTSLLDLQQQTQGRLASLRGPLRNLIRSRNEDAHLSSIRDSFNTRVQGMRELASVRLGDLSESSALQRSGGFNLLGARREQAFFNRQALEETRTKFLSAAGGLGSDPTTTGQIMTATGAADFEAILARAFKGEETKNELREAVTSLKEITLQQETIVRLTEEQNRIDQLILDSQQQQRILAAGTFSGSTQTTSASLFSRLGRSTGVAERANAISLSDYLTQIGLPQTDEGVGFERNVRGASVRDNLAAVLSGRLGRKVEANQIEDAVGQLGGRFGDDALASRINAGLKALSFDPAAARRELLSGTPSQNTLEQLATSGQVGAGSLVLKGPLDSISNTSKESSDILKRIEVLLGQQADITQIGQLKAELVSVEQKLGSAGPNATREQADLANRAAAIRREIEGLEGRLIADSETDLLEAAREVKTAASTGLVAGAEKAKPILMEAFKVGAQRATENRPSLLDTFNTGFEGAIESAARGPFATVEEAMNSLEDVGARVGASLSDNLGNAFGDFVTGAAKGKDAFRSFVTSVLGDAARAFASKALTQLLFMAVSAFMGPSTGLNGTTSSTSTNPVFASPSGARFAANGGPIGFANGGTVPSLLMGGEAVFSPAATKRIGVGTLRAINNGTLQRRANGGGMAMVRGGSGTKDDVPANLPPQSYVIRKAMVERYGQGFLAGLANGGPAPTALLTTTSAGGGSDMGGSSYRGFADGGTASLDVMASYRAFAQGGPTASITTTPATDAMASYRRFTEGGATASITAMPAQAAVASSNGGPVSISTSITINDQRTTASSEMSGGGGLDRQTAALIEQRIRQVTLRTIEEQQRVGGTLRLPSLRST